MKSFIGLLLLCLGVISSNAQTIEVVDKDNLQPVCNVMITGGKIKTSVTTNNYGKADISRFMNSDSLRLYHVNYADLHISINDVSENKFKLFITEKEFSLDEIVVSASRFEEKLKDVAQPIQLIKSKELKLINQPTLADVLQTSGQVLVQKSQLGGGSPIIRGFEANKVLIVMDGIRMNNAIYRGGHLQNILSIDNNTLDRVEIVYGPGSVVYGSDALGGVMHMHTKKPILSTDSNTFFLSNVMTRFATACDEKTIHADVLVGKRKWGSFTSITLSDFDDLRQGHRRNPAYGDFGRSFFYVVREDNKDKVVYGNPNYQTYSGYGQMDVIQKFLYKQNSTISHELNIQYSTTSDIPRFDRLTLLSNNKPKFATWYYGPQERLLTAYTLSRNESSRMYDHARMILAYQLIHESRHDRRFNKNSLNNQMEQVDVLTLNLDFDKRIGKHEIRYGYDESYNYVSSTAYTSNILTGERSALNTRYPDGGSKMQSYAGYLTHTIELTKHFILNDGIRLSHVSLHSDFVDSSFYPFPFSETEQNNSALNGNIGLICMPGHNWRYTLVGSSGYRAPNVDDLSKIFESVPGMVIVPNSNLKPEYTYNVDVGISKAFDKVMTIQTNGFYTWYTNAINMQEGTINGKDSIMYQGELSKVLMNKNSDEAYLYGCSGILIMHLNKSTMLTSALTYTYGRIKTDSTDYPLDHIPPVYGKTSLQWNYKKFRAESFALYNGWKRTKDYNIIGEDNYAQATADGMPAWFTLNVRFSYQINKHLQIQTAMENMLDQNYRVFASGISAPGRNVIISLRGQF